MFTAIILTLLICSLIAIFIAVGSFEPGNYRQVLRWLAVSASFLLLMMLILHSQRSTLEHAITTYRNSTHPASNP